jgi:hypothetical protein
MSEDRCDQGNSDAAKASREAKIRERAKARKTFPALARATPMVESAESKLRVASLSPSPRFPAFCGAANCN